jgi:hypothetical protein
MEKHRAWNLAPLVGVDLWEEEFARLDADPLNSTVYWNVLRTDDPARIGRVIARAEATLPLDEIGTGPADELGLGPAFLAHSCLVTLLQEMSRPGVFSPALVRAGLRSPVVNSRNMAITALESHPVANWGPELVRLLAQAIAQEPRDDVRERLRTLAAKVSGAEAE